MADIVTLDVGGVVYRTTRATLTLYPDSVLGAMFNGKNDVITDDQGRCFIDREGSLFKYVLNFLRCSELVLPEDFKDLDMLGKEAAFYQIEPLVDAIEKMKQDRMSKQRTRETLEMEQVDASVWILRGLKNTLKALYACSKDGNKGWTFTELKMDVLQSNLGLTGEASVVISAWFKDPVVTSIRNIIKNLGFRLTPTTSTRSTRVNSTFDYLVFER